MIQWVNREHLSGIYRTVLLFLGIYFDGHLWYNFFCNIKIICTEVHLCENFISKSINTKE